MRYRHTIIKVAAIAMTALMAACGHDHSEAEKTEETHDHGDEILLEPETAKRFGVETATAEAGEFHDMIRVTGSIEETPMSGSVVSAPTAGIVHFAGGIQAGSSVAAGTTVATIKGDGMSGGDANKTSKAAMDAAKRELDRLTPLRAEGIVSERDYNAALQAYELARSQYSGAAASGRATAVSGGVITKLLVQNGQYVDAGAPIATISANTRLTLRADVPDRHADRLPLVTSAKILIPGEDEVIDLSKQGGRRISGTAASRIMPGYIPLFFSFDSRGKLLPQTVAEVYLIGAARSGVISLPKEAVVEQQGERFIFVKVDEEGYEKRAVKLGASDGERVEITEGVKPGEEVVVKGAMTVKLAESNGAVPEGHSHSH